MWWLACVFVVSIGCTSTVDGIFSTKQFYAVDELDSSSSLEVDDGCRAVQLNMVVRHGTRYPTHSDVKVFDLLEQLVQSFRLPNSGRFGWLSTWRNPFTHTEAAQLAPAGERELYGIAKRYVRRLPALLSQPYSPINYTLRSTGKDRTLQSASAFAFGLFEFAGTLGAARFQPTVIESRHPDYDKVLRFFDHCHSYKQDVKKNPRALAEVRLFMDGPEMQQVVEGVSRRLHLPMNQLKSDDVLSMFTVFGFEQAIFNSSNWGSLFNEEERQVLAYAMDLKQYWKRGYGHDISWKSSCPLLEEIIEDLEDAAKALAGFYRPQDRRKSAKSGVFRFAHAETLLPLLCHLGLFRDSEVLRADNMRSHGRRNFRTSRIVPFSANIAFVLYRCGSGNSMSDPASSFTVKLLVNEREMEIPGCGRDGCRLDNLKRMFRDVLSECDLGRMCSYRADNYNFEARGYETGRGRRDYDFDDDYDRGRERDERRYKRRDFDDDDLYERQRKRNKQRYDDDDDYRRKRKYSRHYDL